MGDDAGFSAGDNSYVFDEDPPMAPPEDDDLTFPEVRVPPHLPLPPPRTMMTMTGERPPLHLPHLQAAPGAGDDQGGGHPGLPTFLSSEPRLAPLEEGESDTDHGYLIVEEAFRGSSNLASDISMDAVRALYPYWSQTASDTELGRRVAWVRRTNDWVYGEMSTASFRHLLQQLGSEGTGTMSSRTFVDLGSGSGKIAALAALHFGQVVGLELQAELHHLALRFAEEHRRLVTLHDASVGMVSLHRADFLGNLTPQWSDGDGRPWWEVADVAYACSPKYSRETMEGIKEYAVKMRPGSHFACVRHRLEDPALQEVWRGDADFTWGSDVLILYKRIPLSQPQPLSEGG